MSGSVMITVEYADPGKPSKTIGPLDVEEAVGGMRDVVFRVAVGEFKAAYVTDAKPLRIKGLAQGPNGDPPKA